MDNHDAFTPDWLSAPGETMSDLMAERDLSLVDFAMHIGQTAQQTSKLLHGRASLTPDIARRLEVVLGGSSGFWMAREAQYRDDVARLCPEAQRSADAKWLNELPVKDMTRFGWLEAVTRPAEKVAECLAFFGAPNVSAWRATYGGMLELAAFRTSTKLSSQPGAVAAWLRQGVIESASIACGPWDPSRFQDQLQLVRGLSRKRDPKRFLPTLKQLCAECGVAVVIMRAPTGCRASGATLFLSPDKALLLLSFRYLSDDSFWFTFFHEAGHLILHGQKAVFLEGEGMVTTREEKDANEFAADVLVPSELKSALLNLPVDGRQVIRFARRIGVSPGIVVGQLQHLGRLKHSQLNNLKTRFVWEP
jgi:HTH-type transcriptional regulator / antitoxin HigA